MTDNTSQSEADLRRRRLAILGLNPIPDKAIAVSDDGWNDGPDPVGYIVASG